VKYLFSPEIRQRISEVVERQHLVLDRVWNSRRQAFGFGLNGKLFRPLIREFDWTWPPHLLHSWKLIKRIEKKYSLKMTLLIFTSKSYNFCDNIIWSANQLKSNTKKITPPTATKNPSNYKVQNIWGWKKKKNRVIMITRERRQSSICVASVPVKIQLAN